MKRVLVIDDDEAVRDSFELALDDAGYEMDVADSGEKGLSLAASKKPDIVFLDLKMPGLDGVDVLRGIHEIDSSIPVYIVTAFHQEYFSRLNEATKDGIEFELARKPLSGEQIRMIALSVLGP